MTRAIFAILAAAAIALAVIVPSSARAAVGVHVGFGQGFDHHFGHGHHFWYGHRFGHGHRLRFGHHLRFGHPFDHGRSFGLQFGFLHHYGYGYPYYGPPFGYYPYGYYPYGPYSRGYAVVQPEYVEPPVQPESTPSGAAPPPSRAEEPSADCREFTQRIVVDGEEVAAYGTACRQPDGSWKIVN